MRILCRKCKLLVVDNVLENKVGPKGIEVVILDEKKADTKPKEGSEENDHLTANVIPLQLYTGV